MECGIDYKSIMFTFDDDDLTIKAFQGETYKNSNISDFAGSDLVLKFIIWRGDLYALVNDGRLLKLEEINSGTTDTWTEVTDTSDNSNDMVNFEDSLYIIGQTNIYKWDGTSLTTKVAIPANHDYYNALSIEDKIYLYGDDNTYTIVDEYDGNTTITELWSDHTHGLIIDWFLYTVYGKPHLAEYKGKLYFTYYYDDQYTHLIEYNLSTDKYRDVTEIGTVEGINTALIIDNDMVLMSIFLMLGAGYSNVVVHILDEYVQEEVVTSGEGQKEGRLFRIESDPMLPSQHDKERLVYYPIYSVIGNLTGSIAPVFKYGRRVEFYSDLNDASQLINLNLKDVVDNICNLLDSYVIIRPENIVEVDKKAMIGRSNLYATLSDDEGYGDIQIAELEDYEQGVNNFRRVSINWNNSIWGSDVEIVGVPGSINVDEFNYNSFLVNNPILAKNIATYIFNNMFSSDVIKFKTEYAPFLIVGKNLNIKAIGSYLYIDENKEFKIVELQHSWKNKFSSITLAERNLIFETLEI
jgi:hypothetical protein